ncbi:HopJ type III effector protein [Maribacter sp. 1_MG-2023]|uniref:HopJ type III effector protein n=1 Tax=Maribacter sp. 1_MG-2023 TaxID=3062677 RepID=UPI0026E35410|nr:HopJ type III effector protein [Maribacter sp. 1_MG-2023]MDO6471727.1 HopJ type III effector protein [Maribacter sp. 1_MG-2023]
MTLEEFKKKLATSPKEISFSDTMVAIDSKYAFTPTAYTNGEVRNEVGQNSGSCKLFSFAIKEGLSKKETLACFGQYYFDEVLLDLKGTSHQNIRNFIETGFEGLSFDSEALKLL